MREIEETDRPRAAAQPAQPARHRRGARRARHAACRRWRCSTPRSTRPCRSARTSTRSRTSSTGATACAATASTARRTATSRTATGSSPGRTREETKIITLHLGNGARRARSTRATRSTPRWASRRSRGWSWARARGDLDPAILDFVAREGRALARRGRRACSTSSRDCSASRGSPTTCASCSPRRDEHDDRRARLAIDMFCYRVRKYIGAYLAAMDGADAIVFAGGIGENSPEVRARICAGLDWLGVDARRRAEPRDGERRGGRRSAPTTRASRCG